MGVAASIALIAFAIAHLTMAASLSRTGGWKGGLRAALAVVVPPLAPWWGFRFRKPRRAWAWIATLAIYTALVIAARV